MGHQTTAKRDIRSEKRDIANGTSSRAHAPSGTKTDVPLSRRDTETGHIADVPGHERAGQDIPSPSRGRDIPSRRQGWRNKPQPVPAGAMNWTHIAASNILEDDAAGLYVDPRKLEAARKLLGR